MTRVATESENDVTGLVGKRAHRNAGKQVRFASMCPEKKEGPKTGTRPHGTSGNRGMAWPERSQEGPGADAGRPDLHRVAAALPREVLRAGERVDGRVHGEEAVQDRGEEERTDAFELLLVE